MNQGFIYHVGVESIKKEYCWWY